MGSNNTNSSSKAPWFNQEENKKKSIYFVWKRRKRTKSNERRMLQPLTKKNENIRLSPPKSGKQRSWANNKNPLWNITIWKTTSKIALHLAPRTPGKYHLPFQYYTSCNYMLSTIPFKWRMEGHIHCHQHSLHNSNYTNCRWSGLRGNVCFRCASMAGAMSIVSNLEQFAQWTKDFRQVQKMWGYPVRCFGLCIDNSNIQD